MNGILMPVKERHEQINKHGYDLAGDRKKYTQRELLLAALYFLTGEQKYYPSTWKNEYRKKIGQKSDLQRIIIACSLLMAEIDRRTKSEISLPTLQIRSTKVRAPMPKEFYFVILAKNGQVLATSETYTRRASARRACNRLNQSMGSYLLITDGTEK